MAHIATRLSDHVEIGAVRRDTDGGVEVVQLDGGGSVRNDRWGEGLLAFDVSYPASTRDDAVFLELRAAYRATGRGTDTFNFRDWSDYQATDEEFGIGDGATTAFQLFKSYTFGSATHSRRIQLPVSPIALKNDGVTIVSGYSVNYTTGIVTFTVAPLLADVLTWTGEFDVAVRFAGPLESTGIATHLEHHEVITLMEEPL